MAARRPTPILTRLRARVTALGDATRRRDDLGGDRGGDRGSVTLETVVLMPLVLLIIMLVVQAGLWMHATHVAQAAATRAASSAAAYQSSAAAGHDAGAQTLAAIGDGVLRNPQVSVTRTATEVRVEIVGTAATVVPGITWTVHAVVVRPVERFVPFPGTGTEGVP